MLGILVTLKGEGSKRKCFILLFNHSCITIGIYGFMEVAGGWEDGAQALERTHALCSRELFASFKLGFTFVDWESPSATGPMTVYPLSSGVP